MDPTLAQDLLSSIDGDSRSIIPLLHPATTVALVLSNFTLLYSNLTAPSLRSWEISKICIYIFPIANLMSSIPVFCILVRYNLLNNGICGRKMANVVSVILPWLLSLFFYAGNLLNYLINWSSAIFFVLLNMSIPLYMYIIQVCCDSLNPI